MRSRARVFVLLVLPAVAVFACGDRTPSTAAGGAASASASASTAKLDGARPPPPEVTDAMRDDARTLAGKILVGGEAMKTLTELTDAYGPRLSGSKVHAAAAAWAADRFRGYGLDAALETFPIARGWVRGSASGSVVAPTQHALHVVTFSGTPATPGGPLRAEVFAIEDATPAGIEKDKDALRGKVVLYGPKQTSRRRGGSAAFDLAKAGAVAMLYEEELPANALTGDEARVPNDGAAPMPYFELGHEDAEMLRRMVGRGPVTVELASTAEVLGPTDVPNVVAELRGRELPDEVVMLGAHLDSWDLANGAQDNGSGSAEVLEAARAIRAMPKPPRRTVRFALWGGEEQGLLGSRAYVKAHAAELDRIVAYLNSDYGAGAPTGWVIGPREDTRTALAPIAKALFDGLGADTLRTGMPCNTDDCSFFRQGIPTLNLDVDGSHYDEVHHLATDTVDKVRAASLAQGAAAMAVAAYTLADLPARIAPRLERAVVTRRVREDGIGLQSGMADEAYWRR